MLRRVGWTLLSAVIGYVLAIVVTFVVLSVAYESRVNRLAVRPDRDRWAFLGALAGLVVGGVAGWWWSGRHPADEDGSKVELLEGDVVTGPEEGSDDEGDDRGAVEAAAGGPGTGEPAEPVEPVEPVDR